MKPEAAHAGDSAVGLLQRGLLWRVVQGFLAQLDLFRLRVVVAVEAGGCLSKPPTGGMVTGVVVGA